MFSFEPTHFLLYKRDLRFQAIIDPSHIYYIEYKQQDCRCLIAVAKVSRVYCNKDTAQLYLKCPVLTAALQTQVDESLF